MTLFFFSWRFVVGEILVRCEGFGGVGGGGGGGVRVG